MRVFIQRLDRNRKIKSVVFPVLLSLGVMLLFSLGGCWEKQSHELLPPETPHYLLTGSIVDEDSQLPLANIPVTVASVDMIYDVQWQTQTIYTDSSGFFQMDTIYPGGYTASVYREGYRIFNYNFMVYHADRELSMAAPRPLVATKHIVLNDVNPGPSNPYFAWQGSIVWMMGIHKGYIQNEYYPLGTPALMPVRITAPVISYEHAFLNPSPSAIGMIYYNDRLYAFYRNGMDIISTSNGLITSTTTWDDPLLGLTIEDGLFYTTWGNNLQFRGDDPTQVQITYPTTTGVLSVIAKLGDHFWAYDRDREFTVILDLDGNVLKTFKLFPDDMTNPIDIYYLNFDSLGRLWVSSKDNINFYRFDETGIDRW